MEAEVVRDAARLAELEQDWTRLEQAVSEADGEPGGTYYLSHRFVSAWWRGYQSQPGAELSVLVLRNNGKVVGIAPLATIRAEGAGRPLTRLRFATHGDYLGFLIDPEAPQETVAKHLMGALETELTWESARLGGIPADSALGQYLLRSDTYNPHFTLHVENPYIDLRRYADFAEFQERQLPKHARKWINRLDRDHPQLTFRVLSGDQDDIFERIGQVHRAERDHLIERHGRTERHSLFDDPARWAHYHRIFTTTDDTRTFVLETPDGTLAGYRTTFRDGPRLLSWNGAYAPAFAEYRIGAALLFRMVEHLLETGEAQFLDLGAGRYSWKFGWTPDFRLTYRLRLERDAPDGAQSGDQANQQRSSPANGLVATRPARRNGSGPRAVRTTYVVSPHPDDETLRTTGFLTGSAFGDAERLVLVAVSDGGSSSLARKRGWTPDEERAVRRAEQSAAWAALTGGRGEIVRLGLPDGALTTELVSATLRQTVPELLEPGARVVVAAHAEDYHADHRAVVRAVRELAPADLATSLAPLMKDPADPAHLVDVSRPSPGQIGAARVAHDAYRQFGQRSVPPEFAALVAQGYRSRLTDPDQPLPRPSGPHGLPLPQVLVLGRTRSRLSAIEGAPAAGECPSSGDERSDVTDQVGIGDLSTARGLRWAAGTEPGAAPDPHDQHVEPLTADTVPSGAGRGWLLAQKVRDWFGRGRETDVPDTTNGTGPDAGDGVWAETLRCSTRARLLFDETDVLLSADPDTDAALARLEALPDGLQVVLSSNTPAVLRAGRQLRSLVEEMTGPDAVRAVADEDVFTARLGEWSERIRQVAPALAQVPVLTRVWADAWLRVADLHDASRTARIREEVLAAVPWETTGPGAALRSALALGAELSPDRIPGENTAVAAETLDAADEAMRAGRYEDALDHLSAAMQLLFHPALEAAGDGSPLRQEPAAHCAPLWRARTFQVLLDRDKEPSAWGERIERASSEQGEASREGGTPPLPLPLPERRARDETHRTGELWATGVVEHGAGAVDVLGRQDLPELAGLIGALHRRPRFGRSQLPADRRTRVWALAARLPEMDRVQVAGNRSGVWVSHLCPSRTRLTVTVSEAEVGGPWLHLIRWGRVHDVVATSEPVAALVRTILSGLDAQVPVRLRETAG